MQLFALKTNLLKAGRMSAFLEDHYICIGWPGIGDLERMEPDEAMASLAKVYRLEGQELADRMQELSMFAYGMADGDYVLVKDEEEIHVGDLGDYYYVENADTPDDGTCHRRGVTWLKTVRSEDLTAHELQRLLHEERAIAWLDRPVDKATLERWLSGAGAAEETGSGVLPVGEAPVVDAATIQAALDILKAALYSEDAERRERAAIAILTYAKS
ncbi:hypothetical protein [Paenibacillus radicis (ex Gao et al. 2016)]|uniref:Uncharacterized protein n=1 Tax=Paenibacillus radicis (ex Gao et al. 2016) TaxID=1737354 RepID=A0A917H417_9BACL|nr:hypothetical protein [Paenibacillus radicis (ex Gao et al. 2016)]GGG66924.1 hypothetical protein GCM10010918_21780 [Paenibacillus radicis (ex Gao et al. 2016)]